MSAERSSVPGIPDPQGIGEDPFLYFTKLYLRFLQGLFSQFPSGSFKWSDDPKSSEIMITDQAPIPRDWLEQRPAIVTIRGPAQFANMTLDQLRSVDARTGERVHTDLIPCTMTLNCLAGQGLEAQRLGWIVMRHIRTFKRLLQKNHMHKVGDEVAISAETPPGALVSPEADIECVNVVVSSPFFFQWTEKITPTDAQVVQAIEAHIHAELLPLEAQSQEFWVERVLSRVPTIRGVPIAGTSVPIDGSKPEPVGRVDVTVKT
jgi:hypothetical protein